MKGCSAMLITRERQAKNHNETKTYQIRMVIIKRYSKGSDMPVIPATQEAKWGGL
jgi:hypothetical protein